MSDFCNKFGFSVECVFSENNKPTLNSVSCGAVIEKFNYRKFKGYDPQKITKAIGLITKNSDINHTACLAKIYRTLKTDKSKRGKLKEELRNNLFTIPVSTTASTCSTVTSQPDQQTQPDQPNVILKLTVKKHSQTRSDLVEKKTIKKEIGKKG